MVDTVQVTGEAHYTDDIPLPSNALRAALVYSDRPHAKLLSVDGSPAFEVGILATPPPQVCSQSYARLCRGVCLHVHVCWCCTAAQLP